MLLEASRLGMVDAAGALRHLSSPVVQCLWDGRRLPERRDTVRSTQIPGGRLSPAGAPRRREILPHHPLTRARKTLPNLTGIASRVRPLDGRFGDRRLGQWIAKALSLSPRLAC